MKNAFINEARLEHRPTIKSLSCQTSIKDYFIFLQINMEPVRFWTITTVVEILIYALNKNGKKLIDELMFIK